MTQLQKISESELIALLKGNQRKGYEYLYDNYSDALYRVIHRIVNDEETANDVLQDAFVKIWNNISHYDTKKGKLFTWMLNLSRNLAIDKTRSKGYNNERKNDSMENVRHQVSSFMNFEIKVDHIGLMDFIDRLTHNEKSLIHLAYFQGYSQSEIAQEYNIPLGTVKSRLRSATVNLKKILTD